MTAIPDVSTAARQVASDAAGRLAMLEETARWQIHLTWQALDDTDAERASAAAREAAETIATMAAVAAGAATAIRHGGSP